MNFPAIVLGFLPGLAWLIFFLQEDRLHPEPKRLIVYTFIVGGLITIPTLATEFLVQDLVKAWAIGSAAVIFSSLAFLEEVFKFAAVYLTVRWAREFDEPLDAMIYMVTGALGFATVENVAVLAKVLEGGIFLEIFQSGIGTVSLRFVGATLLHALASGLVGYYWAVGLLKKRELGYLFFGLLSAVAIHAVFNLLILRFENDNLLYPSLFLIIIAFFLFVDFEKLKEYDEGAA